MSTATADTRTSEDRLSGQAVGDRLAEELQQRRRGGVDRAGRLAAADVHEAAAVVAAVAPRLRLRPVDLHLADGRRLRDGLGEREIALADQPLVEADAAVHPTRTMVRDDEDERVLR